MRFQVLALCTLSLLLVACDPPPAWMPGDPPLLIYVEDGGAQLAAQTACERWSMTGLECQFTTRRSDAAVRWRLVNEAECLPGHTCTGTTDYHLGPRGWIYDTDLESNSMVNLQRVATHEMGHLLGLWEHSDDPRALMYPRPSANGPTSLDLDALAAVWGESPWEDPAP